MPVSAKGKSVPIVWQDVPVLIVWQDVPEDLKLYVVKAEPSDFAKLKQCHNKLINCDEFEDHLVDWLSNYMTKHTPTNPDEVLALPAVADGYQVVVTGMLM